MASKNTSSEDSPYIVSRSRFGELIGITKSHSAHIGTLVNKGYLNDTADKKIDIRDPKNKEFLMRRIGTDPDLNAELEAQLSSGFFEPKIKHEPVRERVRRSEPAQTSRKRERESSGLDPNNLVAHTLADLKTIEDINLKRASVRIKNIEEQRLMGKLLPSDLVESVMNELSNTMLRVFTENCKKWIIDVSHRNRMSGSEEAKLTGEMIDIVNESHTTALDLAEKSLINGIEDLKQIEHEPDSDD